MQLRLSRDVKLLTQTLERNKDMKRCRCGTDFCCSSVSCYMAKMLSITVQYLSNASAAPKVDKQGRNNFSLSFDRASLNKVKSKDEKRKDYN